MSWHLENTGTKQQVTAAIDEAVAMSNGMPREVGEYLKAVIASCDPLGVSAAIYVRSSGHRPINGFGVAETCEVKLVRSGTAAFPLAGQ